MAHFMLFYGWVCKYICLYTHTHTYIYIHIYIYHIYFICLSVDRYMGCFHTMTIINNATMNIVVHVYFLTSVFVFFRYILKSEIAGSCVSSIFEKPPYCFPQWLHKFTLLAIIFKGSLFSTSLLTFVIYVLFDDIHSDSCEVISHCGFDLCFPDDWCSASFQVPAGHLHFPFGEIYIQFSCSFFNHGIFCFLMLSCMS